MSRVFTIFVILGLMAVVALVPQMGTDEPGDQGPDLGEGYAYQADTLRRFTLLLEDPGWNLAQPPRNPQRMLEAAHAKTRLTFVLIPAGSFQMGSSDNSGLLLLFAKPVHDVSVPAFLLCTSECTQRGWDAGGGENRSTFVGTALPVDGVDWTESRDWCASSRLRLPSEAEWEYACRAGTKTAYSWGDEWEPTRCMAENQENGKRSNRGSEHYRLRGLQVSATAQIGSFPANPWGLFDMHGNVSEWCEDTWELDYKLSPTDGSARFDKHVKDRVFRGGSWQDPATSCQSAARIGAKPTASSETLGFRPAADLPE